MAALQRFVSRDPVRGTNRYDYVDNRPSVQIDPRGMAPTPKPPSTPASDDLTSNPGGYQMCLAAARRDYNDCALPLRGQRNCGLVEFVVGVGAAVLAPETGGLSEYLYLAGTAVLAGIGAHTTGNAVAGLRNCRDRYVDRVYDCSSVYHVSRTNDDFDPKF